MKIYKHEGMILQLVAPTSGVVSGVGYVVGPNAQKIFAIAQSTIAQDEEFAGLVEGVVEAPKEATVAAFSVGDSVFWDDTNKRLDVSASGRYEVGYCVADAGATDAVVKVKLLAEVVTAVP